MSTAVADTDSRLPRPVDLAEYAVAGLDPNAGSRLVEMPTLEVEDARPPESPVAEYRARHRLNEDLDTRRIPASVRDRVVATPLPQRVHGAALGNHLVPPAPEQTTTDLPPTGPVEVAEPGSPSRLSGARWLQAALGLVRR